PASRWSFPNGDGQRALVGWPRRVPCPQNVGSEYTAGSYGSLANVPYRDDTAYLKERCTELEMALGVVRAQLRAKRELENVERRLQVALVATRSRLDARDRAGSRNGCIYASPSWRHAVIVIVSGCVAAGFTAAAYSVPTSVSRHHAGAVEWRRAATRVPDLPLPPEVDSAPLGTWFRTAS